MTLSKISVTNTGNNNFTIYQGLTYIAGITPAWLRYSAPALFHDTAELHRLVTQAFTKAYDNIDAAHLSSDEKTVLNARALGFFRQAVIERIPAYYVAARQAQIAAAG